MTTVGSGVRIGTRGTEIRRRRRSFLLLGVVALVELVVAIPSYFRYEAPLIIDDEGYMVAMFTSWGEGGALYDDVFSQYGPFHTVFFGWPLRLADIEPSFTLSRALTLLLAVGAAAMIAVTVLVVTRSALTAVVAQLAVGWLLLELHTAPMHPVAPIAFMIAAIPAVFALSRPDWSRSGDRIVGALVAALLLSKINVGIFASLSVAFVVISALPGDMRRRALPVVELLVLTMGPVLLLSHLRIIDESRAFAGTDADVLWYWTSSYLAGVVAVLYTSRRLAGSDDPADTAPTLRPLLEGFVAVSVATVAAVVVTGTSPLSLVDSMIFRPLGQARTLTLLPLLDSTTLWSVALAVGVAVGARVAPGVVERRPHLLASGGVRLIAGAALFLITVNRPKIPFDGDVLIPIPLVALVLVPAVGSSTLAWLSVRRVLALLAVTHALHAFPVAGLQLKLALIVPVACAALIIDDGRREVLRGLEHPERRMVRLLAMAPAAALGLWLLTEVQPVADDIDDYRAGVAVGLPGTSGLRADLDTRDQLRAVVDELAACDQIFGFPALLSWNVLAGVPAPTQHNATLWDDLLNADEQDAIADVLAAEPGIVCYLDTGVEPSDAGRALYDELESYDEITTTPFFTLRMRGAAL